MAVLMVFQEVLSGCTCPYAHLHDPPPAPPERLWTRPGCPEHSTRKKPAKEGGGDRSH
jgi:hypothetical protein